MSAKTIQIPARHLDAVRDGLIGSRGQGAQAQEIDGLLEQIQSDALSGAGSCELTASRAILWSAVYDSVCVASERLAEVCNEYWRGVGDPSSTRARITDVSERFELLESLGAPPATDPRRC